MPNAPDALSPLAQKAYPTAERFFQADEATLLQELGLRARALEADPTLAGDFDPALMHDTKAMGPLDALVPTGRKILRRWSKEAHGLLCGDDDDDTADRQSLAQALSLGDGAVVAALSGALISMGMAPLLAPVVAALLMSRFIGPTWDEICQAWGASFDDGSEA